MMRLGIALALLLACLAAALGEVRRGPDVTDAVSAIELVDADDCADEFLVEGEALPPRLEPVAARAECGAPPTRMSEPGIDRPPCA